MELRRMYVRHEFRQRGIGTLLVQALIAHCRAKGAARIELWTAGDGLGRLLYEKLGFRQVAPDGTEFDYAKRGDSEIRLRLALDSTG